SRDEVAAAPGAPAPWVVAYDWDAAAHRLTVQRVEGFTPGSVAPSAAQLTIDGTRPSTRAARLAFDFAPFRPTVQATWPSPRGSVVLAAPAPTLTRLRATLVESTSQRCRDSTAPRTFDAGADLAAAGDFASPSALTLDGDALALTVDAPPLVGGSR